MWNSTYRDYTEDAFLSSVIYEDEMNEMKHILVFPNGPRRSLPLKETSVYFGPWLLAHESVSFS